MRMTQHRSSWGKHRNRVRPPGEDETNEAADRRNLRAAQVHHDTVTGRRKKVTLPKMPWDKKNNEENET